MWPPDLLAPQRAAYIRALHSQTAQVTTFSVLNLAHEIQRDIHPIALDGQVDLANDSEADILRTLQAGFFDPDHALRLDSDAPSAGVSGMNMLIRVTVSHYVDTLDRWVSTPLFTGRPSVIGRDGARVALQAQDKACLYLANCPGGKIRKGARVITAIHDVLYALGERFFRFPSATSVTDRVTKDTRYGGGDEDKQPWKVLRKLAHDAGLQLYPDPEGYMVLRPYPAGSPQITWDASTLTANVQTETDLTAIRNRVIATGHKGVKKTADLVASDKHSPRTLANGPAEVPWVNAHYPSATNLRGAKLTAFAKRELTRVVTQGVNVRMSVVPVFHLEPLDRCAVLLAEGSEVFALQDASIPLGAESDMSVGSQKRVRNPSAGRIGVAR